MITEFVFVPSRVTLDTKYTCFHSFCASEAKAGVIVQFLYLFNKGTKAFDI
jgi:hypothetical protein